jgi:hypothetical protein
MRYLLGILATAGLVILILVLLFRGGGSGPQAKMLMLPDYATTGSSAQYSIEGPVVADQSYEQISIDVDAQQVTLNIYKSYDHDLIKTQTYQNSQEAYNTFLKALQNVGFTKVNTNPALKDHHGVCPLSQSSVYSFDNGSKQVIHAWSTPCGSKSFNGNASSVRTLFQRQVPDYSTQISDAKLTTI